MMTERTYRAGERGIVKVPTDSASARLLHDSPPDQESVQVELLDCLVCLEAGEQTEVQRYEFTPE